MSRASTSTSTVPADDVVDALVTMLGIDPAIAAAGVANADRYPSDYDERAVARVGSIIRNSRARPAYAEGGLA